jgi:hypothetical protein
MMTRSPGAGSSGFGVGVTTTSTGVPSIICVTTTVSTTLCGVGVTPGLQADRIRVKLKIVPRLKSRSRLLLVFILHPPN